MDWTKQFEEMSKNWTDAQQKMWKNWTDMAQGAGQSQMQLSWDAMIDTWRNMTQQMLDAQSEGARAWISGVSSLPNMPEETSEWSKTVQEMTASWTDTQKQLWEKWFAMAQKLDPSTITAGEKVVDGEEVAKFWQEATHTINEAQAEWMKLWGVSVNGTKDEAKE